MVERSTGTRSFAEKANEAREKRNHKAIEELGKPQHHSWATLIKVAVADTAMSQQDKEIISAHFEGVKSVSDLADKVFIAKVTEVGPVLDALLRAMSRTGGKMRRGQPPRSGNDRELQDLVDKLAKIIQDD